jgi:transposase-like protein
MQDELQGKTRGQHFLLSAKLRDYTAYDVSMLSEAECFIKFAEFRWGSLDGAICPSCGVCDRPYIRQERKQLRCRHCDHHFSPTVGTPFADRKLDFKQLLLTVALYVSSAKGISACQLSRLIGVQYKTALVLVSKLRECLLRGRDTEMLHGVIEADGGHFCGKPRKGNLRMKTRSQDVVANLEAKYARQKKPPRKPRSKAEARNWARRALKRVVMVVRQIGEKGQGGERTRIAVAYSENQAVATRMMRELVVPGATIMTDENNAYDVLSTWFDHHCVEHAVEYVSADGVNENQAESFFSRMRRAEYGTYHGYRPKYLWDYAQEFAWREDVRQKTELEKTQDLFERFFKNGLSRWFRGYWQGHHRSGEFHVET